MIARVLKSTESIAYFMDLVTVDGLKQYLQTQEEPDAVPPMEKLMAILSGRMK